MSKNLYQCFLFKQFTTGPLSASVCFKCQRTFINVFFSSNSKLGQFLHQSVMQCQRTFINVFFSSNSQHGDGAGGVRTECQRTFINVFFSSNSQHMKHVQSVGIKCQRTFINVFFSSNSQRCGGQPSSDGNVKEPLSMFSFQAIHNCVVHFHDVALMSKNLYQCFLFKQFTTRRERDRHH